ncbi:MAG: hypothetical protein ABI425_02750 [Patescibacteria group bacterium]
MAQLRTTSFVGQSSTLAAAQTASGLDHCVAFAISGPDAQQISKDIQAKFQHTDVDSPTSFLSLIERAKEQWSELYGELAAVFVFEEKMYLLVMNGEIWLKRGEKFGRVLKSSEELKVVEGRVQDQDNYLVLTQSTSVALSPLFAQVTEGKLHFSDIQLHIQSHINSSGLSDRCVVSVVEVVAEPMNVQPDTPAVTPTVPQVSWSVKLKKYLYILKKISRKAILLSREGVRQIPPAIAQLRQLKNRQWTKDQRRKIAVALLSVCAIGFVLIGFLVFRSVQIHQGQVFLQPFQQRLELLSQLANTDTVAARDQVLVLQKEFESQQTGLKGNLFVKGSLTAFSSQVSSFVKDVSGKVELQTLPIFYDFRLVRADFIAAKADTDQNSAVFLDLEKQVAISLMLDTKQQTLLPIGQYPTLKDLSFSTDQLFVLADGVYKFPIDSKKAAEKIIPEGDSNREGQFVRVFGDYIYVFNAEKRNLFRYSVAKDGDEAPQPIGWFQDKKDLDFPSISSFAIDGDVWLGTQQGQILRYQRGNPAAFSVQGLQDPFSSMVKVYTKENLDSLFVLESGKNRVVRLSKDGVFVRQIQSPSLGAATDIIFSPTTNKAYALAGSLVYELEL